jgi:2'-hydroxyisoflavone reductase
MKLLIIGGTRFLGRHLVASALAANLEVTLFNRGNHPAPPNVESIHGDRNTDLAKLRGRRWDVVIDTCGMMPASVSAAAEFLSESVDRYVYLSSQSAYADVSYAGVKESAPLATLTGEQLEETTRIDKSGSTNYGKLYGGLKALCEQAAERAMPDRVLIFRPGLIVGPDDYTDRFTYWVVRVAQGGEVLAPGRQQQFVQFIDVRDLAEWIVRMVEVKAHGIYNTSGAPETVTMQRLLDECRTVNQSDASFTWVSEEFLLTENVAAWSDMPLWLPEDAAPHLRGFMFINSDKAVRAGLNYRPLDVTVRDTLEWYRTARANEKLKAGIDRDQEVTVLGKWHDHIKAISHSATS